jgi:hypothetical protein
MRTSSILLAFVLSGAAAAQSVFPEGRSISLTAALDRDATCLRAGGKSRGGSAFRSQRGDSGSVSWNWCLDLEEVKEVLASHEFDAASVTSWIARAAKRLVATVDAG